MFRAFIQRIFTLWLAITIAFFALRILPGEALRAELVLAGADEQTIDEQQAALGLNQPTLVLYMQYLGALLRGDLGDSLLTRQPVAAMLAVNIPPTLALASAAFAVAVITGILLGTMAAVSRGMPGTLARVSVALLLSVPIYWSGTLAIYLFSILLNWLPSSGVGGMEHLVLPAAVLGIHAGAAIGRATQLALSESLVADYTRTARAKGLGEGRVLFHAVRAAITPIITTAGLQAGFLLGGTVITEMLFVRPGIGRLMLDAALRRDFPVLLGGVLFTTISYVAVNTLADMLNRQLDPRIRL